MLNVVIRMILFALPKAVFDKLKLLVFDVQVSFLCYILAESSSLWRIMVYPRK